MLEPLRKYAVFSGRARRREYWLWQLLVIIITFVLVVLATPMMGGESGNPAMISVLILFILAILLPSLAVAVRRLHDANFSGLWLLVSFIPGGGLVLLVFFLIDGTTGPNRFGPDPKGRI